MPRTALPGAPDTTSLRLRGPARRLILTTALTIGMGGLLVGCYGPAGSWMPATGDASTYESTETRPKTVVVLDLRTDEEIISIDVPVGKQLTLDFVDGGGDDPAVRPDLMRYQIFDAGTKIGRLENSITVPAAMSRRVDMTVRPPEMARSDSMGAARPLRTDEVADRPDWWSPEGGEMPETRLSELYDN